MDLDSSSSSDDEVPVQEKVPESNEIEFVDEQVAATTEDAGDSEDELRVFKDPDPASREWKNRQRTLVMCSRGLGGRMRHLVDDLCNLIPNTKRESKVQRKDAIKVIDDIAYERSCNNCMFWEQRKQQDLYLWLSKSPVGPSAKFLVQNISTTDELKLSGNCLKYSRPLLSFDEGFDSTTAMRVQKELLC